MLITNRRQRLASRLSLQLLEPRLLLNGLTIITHGYEPSGASPGWLNAMADAIVAREGPSTAVYDLQVLLDPTSNPYVSSFTRLSGPAPVNAGNATNNNVLLLDWAAASNVLANYVSTSDVASVVMPYLTTTFPDLGMTGPLAEGPIALIGHSRGASLVSVIAQDLGQSGIWVDQLTTLDPVPVFSDPDVSLGTNIVFADNYYQNSGDGILTPNGTSIDGAENFGPLSLGETIQSTHDDVHLFYQGTIDLSASANDGTDTVPSDYYSNNLLPRNLIGFYYNYAIGGARPAAGVSALFGGSAARSGLTLSGTQWPDIGSIAASSTVITSGQNFYASFKYENTSTNNATVQWFFDPDQNPYNSNSIAIGTPTTFAPTGANVLSSLKQLPAGVAPGTYYLEARINNGNATRYSYDFYRFTIKPANVPPIGSLDLLTPYAAVGWALDTNTPATAITIRLDIDGITFSAPSANLSRPDLIPYYGSANHGFSLALPAMSYGLHRIDLYAYDSTTLALTLITSRELNTNLPPTGYIDSFNGSQLQGWAFDANSASSSIQIRYTIDNNAPILASASLSRPDLVAHIGSALHGFAITLPALTAGTHTVTVWAVDSTSDALTLLGIRSAVVTNPPANPLPRGFIDILTATQVAGWAFDSSAGSTPINIRIDIDGALGTPTPANLSRPDLTPVVGSPNHGFNQSLSLSAGAHRIDIYAIDSPSGTPVLLQSQIVSNPAPTGWLDTLTKTTAQGWAYLPALAAAPASVRLDIDNTPALLTTAAITRPDLLTPLGSTDHGFSITLPDLTPGTHLVKLYVIDPITLTPTLFAATSITI